MIELYQTEWCPASHRIRQLLTELGIDYTVRQVAVERVERSELLRRAGTDEIPALVLEDGAAVNGEAAIRNWLEAHVAEMAGAEAHRRKAEIVHSRQLRDACAELETAAAPSAGAPQ
jgi:glutathione S-transferase